jgi:hypothetical protein
MEAGQYVADDNFTRAASTSEARAGHPTNPVEMLCNEAFAQLMQFTWWIVPEEAEKKKGS